MNINTIKKVLVVDDNIWQADQYLRILANAQYHGRSVTQLADFFEVYDEFSPDILIMDIMLDYNSSFVLLHELQSHVEDSVVPVIICSNVAENFTAKSLSRYGVVAVLDKLTMHPNDIISTIKKVQINGETTTN